MLMTLKSYLVWDNLTTLRGLNYCLIMFTYGKKLITWNGIKVNSSSWELVRIYPKRWDMWFLPNMESIIEEQEFMKDLGGLVHNQGAAFWGQKFRIFFEKAIIALKYHFWLFLREDSYILSFFVIYCQENIRFIFFCHFLSGKD